MRVLRLLSPLHRFSRAGQKVSLNSFVGTEAVGELHAKDVVGHPSREGATRATAETAGPRSRIYELSRKREQKVDISEALRALRAYSSSESPETVSLSIKVDMTIKKVRVILKCLLITWLPLRMCMTCV